MTRIINSRPVLQNWIYKNVSVLRIPAHDEQFREADDGRKIHDERIHRVVDVETVTINFQRQAVDSTDLITERIPRKI